MVGWLLVDIICRAPALDEKVDLSELPGKLGLKRLVAIVMSTLNILRAFCVSLSLGSVDLTAAQRRFVASPRKSASYLGQLRDEEAAM